MTQATSPGVSVVMRIHNSEAFLGEALESILQQSFPCFELIAVDDGSTDATPDILSRFASRDRRIRIHRQDKLGPVASGNAGFQLARAPYLAILDADDLASPDRLEAQVRFLDEHPEIGVVGGASKLINAAGVSLSEDYPHLTDAELRQDLEHFFPAANTSLTYRRELVQRAGGYRPQFPHAHDLDLLLRVSEVASLANLGQIVTSCRFHAGQISMQRFELQALCSVAARVSARHRRAGAPDPIAGLAQLDEPAVLAAGATKLEIDRAYVHLVAWLAEITAEAGYDERAGELFGLALDRAHGSAASPELLGHVHRQRARAQGKLGHALEARIESASAWRAERSIIRFVRRRLM